MTPVECLLAAARDLGGTVVETPAAVVLVLPRSNGADPEEHLDEGEAMKLTRKTKRQLADARRSGALPFFGRQRSHTYRRGDLLKWLEERKARPLAGPDDADIARRFERLSRTGRRA